MSSRTTPRRRATSTSLSSLTALRSLHSTRLSTTFGSGRSDEPVFLSKAVVDSVGAWHVPGTGAVRTASAAPSSRWLLGVVPVVADADVDRKRGVERVRLRHLLTHELAHRRHLRLRNLEQQLVVDLEHQLRRSTLRAQPAVHPEHRDLDDVRVRALHHEVDGEPLAQRPRLPVRGANLRHGTAPAEQARDVAVASRLLDRPLDEVLD